MSKKKIRGQILSRKRIEKHVVIIGWIVIMIYSLAAASAQTDTVQCGDIEEVTIRFVPPTMRTAGNITTISLQQIRAQQGNGSVNNLLELMPAMVTTSDAGTGVGYTYMRLRGIDQTRINTTLNGVTINDAESQGSWLVNLPDMGSFIEQVMAQSGANTSPGTISYGSRIDFKTRDIPQKAFAELNSSYGSFNTFHNMVSVGTGVISKRLSVLASFSDVRSNGYIDRSSAQLNSVFFTAKYHLLNSKQPSKDYGVLKFNLLYGNEHTGLAWNGVPYDSLMTNRTYNMCGEYFTNEGERRYYTDEKDHFTQTHYQLEYEKWWKNSDFTRSHKLKTVFHFRRGMGYYQEYKDDKDPLKYGLSPLDSSISNTDLITQKYLDNYFYGVHTQYEGSVKSGANFVHAFSWYAGFDVDNYNGRHYGNVIWTEPSTVQCFPVDYQWYNGNGDKLHGRFFAAVGYAYKGFSVNAELQYRMVDYKIGGTDDNMVNIDQFYYWNFVNPRITLHYLLNNNKPFKHSFDLSFATSNREPTRSDIVDAPSSTKPVPESLYDIEFSYMLYHKKFYANVTLYGMYYVDQMVLTGELNDVGASIMTNVDKSYRMGVEVAVAYRPVRFFAWHVNGCFSRNRILNFVNHVDDWDNGGQIVEVFGNTPISFSPNIVLGNDFTITPFKNFDISLITKYVSKQFIDNSGNLTRYLEGYSYSNVRIGYLFELKKFAKELALFLQINNIFNAQYSSNAWIYSYYYAGTKHVDAGYFPQAGINVLGGLRLKF